MPDRYEILRDKHTVPNSWGIRRINDDPEFGFVKLVGTFQRKGQAEHALARIQLHDNMNFSEWFYTQEQFYTNVELNQEVMSDHFYTLWRSIGGHLTVSRKVEVMQDMAKAFAYVSECYEEKIMDLQDEIAMTLAGEDW